MAYQTPRTWTAGETVTAALMNQDVRDNVSFLANPPTVRVRQTTTQSLTNVTWTTITFTTESWDSTGDMHDNATNNSRLTAPVAGKYWVYGCVAFTSNGTGDRLVGIRTNSSGANPPNQGATFARAAGGLNTHVQFATEVSLSAGGYVELVAYQSSGGALSTTVDVADPHFGMRFVSL